MRAKPVRVAMLAGSVIRSFGWRGLARRLRHERRRRTDAFLRGPAMPIAALRPSGDPVLVPRSDFAAMPQAWRSEAVLRGERVLDGEYEAYGWDWRRLPRTEEAWKRDPLTGFRFADEPWWRVETLPPEADIKDVWEPARFSWSYDLVRAWLLTGRREFADAFWERVQAWASANPPFLGVHWVCGQETAIRALALSHAVDALPVVDEDASGAVLQLLAWSGERIADGIGYGASQRNNHGISEAAALVHLGLRFERSLPVARRWLRMGQRILEEQVLDQFAEDGWYAQHSFTYLRLALEQASLAQRALLASGRSLRERPLRRLARGVELLIEVTDGTSGIAPNHGPNDGALLTRYSLAPYRDMRPAITLATAVLGVPMPADLTPDEAVLAWLGSELPRRAPARGDGVVSGASGWASARLGPLHVFLRAGRYRHRPSHADGLHLDVRHGGREIVVDPGTYAYNRPPPWRNGLATARVHNGPIVDGRELGERGPRFSWYAWPKARLRGARYDADRVLLEADAPGGAHRSVAVTRDGVLVEDTATLTRNRTIEVSWLLAPGVSAEALDIDAPVDVVEPREGDPRGWFSPSYAARVPSVGVEVRAVGSPPRIRTRVPIPAASSEEGSTDA